MNYEETKDTLKNYLLARIPLIIVESLEKQRVINVLKDINKDSNSSVFVHAMSKGMYDINTEEIVSSEKTLMGVLTYIASEIKNKKNVTYLLTDASDLESDSLLTRYLCDIVTSAEEKSCSIVIINENRIWPNLKRLGMSINLAFPSSEEILVLLHKYLDNYKNEISINWNENNYKEASVILLGLSESEIKNVISVLIARKKITEDDLIELKFAKSNLFSNMDGLERIDADGTVYGGLNNLKKWLSSKKKLFDVENKEYLIKRGLKPPRGILVVGVPGCGKSLTAKAIASSWNLPLYLLDFAMVQGMYVGQSEEQLKRALQTAEHVSPCVLWIDEIEKGLSGIKDSTGVTSRMVGQFLFWLQECEKEVFVVATANDVNTLPPELLRKGRFDELFFVDLPNESERKEILDLYFQKYLGVKLDDEYINELVGASAGFASSDIESAIRDISYNTIAEKTSLTKQYILDYFNSCTSVSKTNPEKINAIRAWGEARAKKAS